jgi:protein-S-isoprenylcysteine O-methyltransferase Ste14
MTTYSLAAKQLRVPLGFLLGGLYLAFARTTPLTLAVGGAIALAGVLVRAWAAGHIVKNDRLATSGPYAHTRNPLYFGSFLIGAGFAVAVHWALLLLVIAFWILVYLPTMERERSNIRTRFPEAYAEYEAHVPAFMPRVLPWGGAGDAAPGPSFSLALYLRHGEWRAGLVFFLALGWLWARMRLGL